MLRRALLLACAWVPIAWGAWAGVSEGPDSASLTIYRSGALDTADLAGRGLESGLAMITETRTVEVPAGRSVLTFRGVADGVIPQTAVLQGLPGAEVERNVDYDLMTPGALLEKSIGRTVRLVRTLPGGKVEDRTAIVRSAPEGVVLEVDGRFEALSCSNLPERLIFDHAPPLADRPTLSVMVDAPRPMRKAIKLSYLTTGMTWSADYVAHVRADGRTLDLSGWITLANQTSLGFHDAPTQVVAGSLARDEDSRPIETSETVLEKGCWFAHPALPAPAPPMMARYGGGGPNDSTELYEEIVVTGARMAKQGELGDYKLYTLPEPTTVAARQIKQVLFLDQKAVPFERYYAYQFDPLDHDDKDDTVGVAELMIRLQNDRRQGLGKPLPAGSVMVMAAGPGGAPIMVGKDRLEQDVPVGLPAELTLGGAPEVTVRPRIVREEDVPNSDRERADIEVIFDNHKPEAVIVEYRHAASGQEGFKLVSASRRYTTKAGDPLWRVPVPAGGQATLTYRIETD